MSEHIDFTPNHPRRFLFIIFRSTDLKGFCRGHKHQVYSFHINIQAALDNERLHDGRSKSGKVRHATYPSSYHTFHSFNSFSEYDHGVALIHLCYDRFQNG